MKRANPASVKRRTSGLIRSKLQRLTSPEPCAGRLSFKGRAELANPVASAEVVCEPVFRVILGLIFGGQGCGGHLLIGGGRWVGGGGVAGLGEDVEADVAAHLGPLVVLPNPDALVVSVSSAPPA